MRDFDEFNITHSVIGLNPRCFTASVYGRRVAIQPPQNRLEKNSSGT
jgi:hypothetical protein